MLDNLLKKFNVKYEDLNATERETLNGWLNNLQSNQVTVESIKDHVSQLINAVEKELSTYNLSKEQDLFLKARLKNYLMLQDFITSADKARKHIEQSLNNIK